MKHTISTGLGNDSIILEIEESGNAEEERLDEELVYATKNSLLFRVRKDGKYFLIKRSAGKSERAKNTPAGV